MGRVDFHPRMEHSHLVGRLQKTDGSAAWLIPARCLIGRSRVCQFRVDSLETSGEHALLRWRSGLWELQDLHSHNGTYVDGRVLGQGQRVSLGEGTRLGFGHADEYVLIQAGPPQPYAVNLDASEVILEAHGGFLALPNSDAPEVTVLYQRQQWRMERGDDIQPVSDGDMVETDAARWLLHLPEQLPTTRDSEGVAPTLASLTLRFTVSDGGKTIALCAFRGERTIDLKVRAHHAPLLALARARLRDQHLNSGTQGWVEQADLVTFLGCETSRLHVDIHRLRRQLAAAGILDAAHIIERRRSTRALRMYPSKIEIVTAGETTPEGSADASAVGATSCES